jgi:hypothetical protein
VETILSLFTGTLGDWLSQAAGFIGVGLGGYFLAKRGDAAAASGAIVKQANKASEVAVEVAAASDDDLKKRAEEWTR